VTGALVVLERARPVDRPHARLPRPRVAQSSTLDHPGHAAILALQRAAGNAAVSALLTVQRCGDGPCGCAEEAAGDLAVQREPKDDKKDTGPRDVVLILSPTSERADALTEAAVMAPGAQIVYATSVKEMIDRLKALKTPVKTLYFVGHSTADGDIVFETPSKRDFVRAETIAQKVKGVIQAESVDFHGCAAAVSPGEIDKVRAALKAKRARASTCEVVRQVAGPITAPGNKAITDRATFDLTKPENRKLFDAGLKKLRDSFGDERKKCVINDSEDGYFQAHGRLVAVWANPESIAGNNAFDKDKSVCYEALKLEKLDPSKNPVIDENQCKLVELG